MILLDGKISKISPNFGHTTPIRVYFNANNTTSVVNNQYFFQKKCKKS